MEEFSSISGEEHIPVFVRAEELLFIKLMSGKFQNNEVIRESLLAQELGVSRRAMREALCQAVGWGVVEYESFKGFRICDFSLKKLYDLEQLRDGIETVSARHLARNCGSREIKYLEDLMKSARTAGEQNDHVLIAALDIVYHLQLVRLSGNEKFCSPGIICYLMVLMNMAYLFGSYRYWYENENQLRRMDFNEHIHFSENGSLREHQAVVDAIKKHDHELAATLTHLHIQWQLNYLEDAAKELGWDIKMSELPTNETMRQENENRRRVFEHVSILLPELLSDYKK